VAAKALLSSIRAVRRARAKLLDGGLPDEAIHDFRVSLRRLRTLLAAARPLLRRKAARRASRALSAAARATGPLRDEEVLTETLSGLALRPTSRSRVDAWLEARATEARALRNAGVAAVTEGGLMPALDGLEELLARGSQRDRALPAFAAHALARARRDVAELAPHATVDALEPLHRLRLAMKRLRYLAEWLAGVFAAEAYTRPSAAEELRELARAAAHYQKEFGLVHDLDVASETLAVAVLDGRVRGAVLRALAARRRAVATPAIAQLRAELGRLVMEPGDGGVSAPRARA
jgi:CHAD domain-containing protein